MDFPKHCLLTKNQLLCPLFAVTGKAEKEVDLEQYFKPTEILHCTTKFCNYGKKDGAKEYAQNPVSGQKSAAGGCVITLFNYLHFK